MLLNDYGKALRAGRSILGKLKNGWMDAVWKKKN